MNKKFVVRLSVKECAHLESLVAKGNTPACRLTRARVLGAQPHPCENLRGGPSRVRAETYGRNLFGRQLGKAGFADELTFQLPLAPLGGRVALEQKTTLSRPVCWAAAGPVLSLGEWKRTTNSESGSSADSGLPPGCFATERLEEAQRQRIWAVVESHQSGLSIRQIAAATGLSSSRVHQLLGSEESREIPRWLSQRCDQKAARSKGHPDLQARLAGEMDALRRCREWLERLERGEQFVVNLRPETDPETEYVSFDRPRVLRVLARIIADLDELAGFPPIAEEEAKKEGAEARRVRHRRLLAEPDPTPKRLTMREERAALRALLDLPPSENG